MNNNLWNEEQYDLLNRSSSSSSKKQIQENNCQFPQPVHHNEDPFILLNPHTGVLTKNICSEISLSIEEELQLLINGNQEVLIQNYYKNISGGNEKIDNTNSNQLIQQKPDKQGDSKNIPKNLGKQIIKFIKKKRPYVQRILKAIKSPIKYEDLNKDCQKRKRNISKIRDLQELWLQNNPFGREMRVISQYFLRKWSYNWIFNSRILDYTSHLKYCKILLKLIQRPSEFINLRLNQQQHQRAIQ